MEAMNIPEICKLISSNLTHNLRLAATADERQQYLSRALQGIGDKVIPSLNRLLSETEEGSQELDKVRSAALDLTTFVCIDFIRNCTNYRCGISCLDELTANCLEPQLKKKLAIYTNQLKYKWNIAEPGGIAHNPRAKRLRPQTSESKTLANALKITLFLGVALYFFAHLDLTSLIFPRWNEPRQPEPVPQMQVVRQQEAAVQTPPSLPSAQPQAATQSPEPTAGSFYSYTDKQGVVNLVDDLDKVPRSYRQSMKVTQSSTQNRSYTQVVIKGDRVMVPVTLSFRGRSVAAHLLLDTGATVTTISEQLASRLGVEATDLSAGRSTVADGRSISSYTFEADSLAVGSRSLSHIQASILPGSSGVGYDGLLGMNFLKNFRYNIDFSRSVIEWDR